MPSSRLEIESRPRANRQVMQRVVPRAQIAGEQPAEAVGAAQLGPARAPRSRVMTTGGELLDVN